MASFTTHWDRLRARVDTALDRYLPSGRQYPSLIHRAIRHSVLCGGKRIRPIVAIESYGACGGRGQAIMTVACALEFIHTYSLIHDDLPALDNDDFRRGRPSAHKKFGEANAILAGDALLTMAFSLLARKVESRYALRIINEISGAIGTAGMIGGQVVDVEKKGKTISLRETEYINAHKTAALMRVSAKAGAILAGAARDRISAMADFGYFLGLLFQITDDMLDNEDYIMAMGIDRARMKKDTYEKSAWKALGVFGARAKRLRALAERIALRTR